MSDETENPGTSRRRRRRRSYALLILAAGIFLFGVAAGSLYLLLRPTVLRIAVGPPGSDDQKLVQTLAQIFAREASPIRLSPITTEGATESIAMFAAGASASARARGGPKPPARARTRALLRATIGAR